MRPRLPPPALVVLTAALVGVLAFAAGPPASPLPAPAPIRVDFTRDVQPILSAHCLRCHGPDKQKGDLRLDQPQSARRNGSILPGDSRKSPLIHRVAGIGDAKRMPPSGPGLTPRQVAVLRAWVDQGASWPDSAAALASTSGHWAYRPLVRPAVPAVQDRDGLLNPIDAFIQARLEAARLSPAPPAERRLLIRRLSFDLTGLPPAPQEVDAFVSDSRPDAYERLVDRLLASPAY